MPISSGPLEDRLAIRELIDSYNDAVMRFDGEAWAENWTDDATWTLPGAGDLTGKDVFVPVWRQSMSKYDYVGFFSSAGPITIDGDNATGTWYQQEFLHQKDGVKRSVTGKYSDTYVKTDGRWYFSKRVYDVLDSQQS